MFAHGMTPIVCVGETLEERDAGGTESKVQQQVDAGVRRGRARGRPRPPSIAYEPIWAIGTGRNAEPADAGYVMGLIRGTIAEALRRHRGRRASAIQYGGSVKPGNIRDFMAHPEIDGALVGGASLDPEDFALIVKYR